MVSIDVHMQTHWAENSPVTTILYDSSIYEVQDMLTVIVVNLLLPHGSTKLAVDYYRKRTLSSKHKAGGFKCCSAWSLVSRVLLKAGVRGSEDLIIVNRNWNMGYCAILMLLKRTRDIFFPLSKKWRKDSSSNESYFSFYMAGFKYFNLCFHSVPSNEHLRVFSLGNLREKLGERVVSR